MHSATKYLNGHSDVIAGALVGARDDEHGQAARHPRPARRDPRAVEAWLLLRGMRTLYLRVAMGLPLGRGASREHFAAHPMVERGALSRPARHRRPRGGAKQMSGGFGGMLSIRVKGGERAAIATAARVELWKRATSLGGVESLIEHRASIEGAGHALPARLLRLSVGIEDADDLIADLDQALRRAHNS